MQSKRSRHTPGRESNAETTAERAGWSLVKSNIHLHDSAVLLLIMCPEEKDIYVQTKIWPSQQSLGVQGSDMLQAAFVCPPPHVCSVCVPLCYLSLKRLRLSETLSAPGTRPSGQVAVVLQEGRSYCPICCPQGTSPVAACGWGRSQVACLIPKSTLSTAAPFRPEEAQPWAQEEAAGTSLTASP